MYLLWFLCLIGRSRSFIVTEIHVYKVSYTHCTESESCFLKFIKYLPYQEAFHVKAVDLKDLYGLKLKNVVNFIIRFDKINTY